MIDIIKKNKLFRVAAIGQSLGILGTVILKGSVGTLYLKEIGIEDHLIFFWLSTPVLLWFVKLFVARLTPLKKEKSFLLITHLFAVAILGVGLNNLETSKWIVFSSIVLTIALIDLGGVFWYPILQSNLAKKDVIPFFSSLRIVWKISLTFGLLAISAFLDIDGLSHYQYIFTIAAILLFLRILIFTKLPLIKNKEMPKVQSIKKNLKSVNFKQYIFFFLLFMLNYLFGNPLFLYMKSMGLSNSKSILVDAIGTAFMIGALLYTPKLTKLLTTKTYLSIMYFFYSLSFLAFSYLDMLDSNVKYIAIISIFSIKKVFDAILGVIFANFLFRTTKESIRSEYISYITFGKEIFTSAIPLLIIPVTVALFQFEFEVKSYKEMYFAAFVVSLIIGIILKVRPSSFQKADHNHGQYKS